MMRLLGYSTKSALKVILEEQGKDFTKIQNLKVTGEININDFHFMRDEMLDLKRLNIEEVKIASGVGRNGYGQKYTAEENTIPQGALNGKTLLERVILPNNIVKIDGDAFGYTRLLNVNIPNSVKNILNSKNLKIDLIHINSPFSMFFSIREPLYL